jgi:hypothetical protein
VSRHVVWASICTLPVGSREGRGAILLRLFNAPQNREAIWLTGEGKGHLDLPRMAQGGFVGGFFAIYIPSPPQEDEDGIDVEVDRASPYSPVLKRPNHYQNRIQFFNYWMLSKLMRGNTYALKQRDSVAVAQRLTHHIESAHRRVLGLPRPELPWSLENPK